MSWLQKVAQITINVPYYRVVCTPLYGNNSGKGNLSPGSYWTPNWSGVQSMLKTVLKFWLPHSHDSYGDKFQTQVWELKNAIMEEPPESHSWAFNFGSDAGEMVLVQAISPPEKIYDLHPSSREFLELIEDHSPMIDYRKDPFVIHDGKRVHLSPNYRTKCIDVAEETGRHQFSVVNHLRSLEQFDSFLHSSQVPEDFDNDGALAYFVSDMGWVS